MTGPTNGHTPAAAGALTRTPSFAPITPVVKERVGDVATRLSEVEKIIDDLNLQSATSTTRSPTIGDLQQEIDLLKKDIEESRFTQKNQIDELRSSVKNDVKEQITRTMWSQIGGRIMESVEARVRVEVGEWGQSAPAKKLIGSLKNMTEENDVLIQEAQVQLDNSRSRHDNSTLDEQADFETSLSKIKLPDGRVSKAFPRTLKNLFSYDEHQLLQLFDDYGLQKLNTHLENLNRFLAFIGLRFSIPEQPLDFLGEPPAYPSPDILEPLKKEIPREVFPMPPPDQGENKTKVTPEVQPDHEKPPQERTATNDNPAQVLEQEKRSDEKWIEEEHKAQQGQRLPGIELAALPRQPLNQRLQQSSPSQPAAPYNRAFVQPLPRPALPQPRLSQPSNPKVSGWLKSFTEGF